MKFVPPHLCTISPASVVCCCGRDETVAVGDAEVCQGVCLTHACVRGICITRAGGACLRSLSDPGYGCSEGLVRVGRSHGCPFVVLSPPAAITGRHFVPSIALRRYHGMASSRLKTFYSGSCPPFPLSTLLLPRPQLIKSVDFQLQPNLCWLESDMGLTRTEVSRERGGSPYSLPLG